MSTGDKIERTIRLVFWLIGFAILAFILGKYTNFAETSIPTPDEVMAERSEMMQQVSHGVLDRFPLASRIQHWPNSVFREPYLDSLKVASTFLFQYVANPDFPRWILVLVHLVMGFLLLILCIMWMGFIPWIAKWISFSIASIRYLPEGIVQSVASLIVLSAGYFSTILFLYQVPPFNNVAPVTIVLCLIATFYVLVKTRTTINKQRCPHCGRMFAAGRVKSRLGDRITSVFDYWSRSRGKKVGTGSTTIQYRHFAVTCKFCGHNWQITTLRTTHAGMTGREV